MFGWSFALIVIVLVSVIAFLANTHYINARSLTNLFSQFGNGVSSFVLHCDAWHVLLAVVATVICVFVLTLMIQQTAIHVWIMWSNLLPVLRDVACARRLISLYFHNKSTMFLFLLCIMCASPLIPSVAAMKAGDSAPACIGGAIMDTLTVAGELITAVLQNTPTSVAHVRGTDDEDEFEAALQQQNDDRASELPVYKNVIILEMMTLPLQFQLIFKSRNSHILQMSGPPISMLMLMTYRQQTISSNCLFRNRRTGMELKIQHFLLGSDFLVPLKKCGT